MTEVAPQAETYAELAARRWEPIPDFGRWLGDRSDHLRRAAEQYGPLIVAAKLLAKTPDEVLLGVQTLGDECMLDTFAWIDDHAKQMRMVAQSLEIAAARIFCSVVRRAHDMGEDLDGPDPAEASS